jgi:hypothetical protein
MKGVRSMQTMTCKQLGGPCDVALRGATADDVIKAQDAHLKNAVAKGDGTHEQALKDMKGRWKHPIAGRGCTRPQSVISLLYLTTDPASPPAQASTHRQLGRPATSGRASGDECPIAEPPTAQLLVARQECAPVCCRHSTSRLRRGIRAHGSGARAAAVVRWNFAGAPCRGR